jgi:GWxTD domain-containing protein
MNILKTLIILVSLTISSILFGQDLKLRAYLDSKQFYTPNSGNYIEIYFQYVGYSVNYKSIDGGLQGELAVSIAISDGQNKVAGDVYRLQTPMMKDSIVEDFYDIRRFALKPGNYTLSIELQDLNSTKEPIKTNQPFIIEDFESGITVSDIEAIEYATKGDESSTFFKSGYNMIPRLSTFYPSELSSIPVYFELYNTNELEDSVCGIKQYLVNTETGTELSDLTLFTRHSTTDVLPILRNVNIEKIPTGKYALNFTLLSRNLTELTTQSYLFERSNDAEVTWDEEKMVLDPAFQASITTDSVIYYLESLIPISKSGDVKNLISVIKMKDENKQRIHIQAFWLKTAPTNFYEAWVKYKAQVQLVERLYSNNFQEGFETDRGRVYLQYGSPTNIIIKETSPSEYPYEIWQFNKIGAFSNRRFIFYNPDLVNNTYRLLHSDMIGELKNPGWPQILSTRNSNDGNVQNPNGDLQDHWGGNSNDLFRQY